MHGSFTIFPLGDSALIIDFGDQISIEINNRVQNLFRKLKAIEEPIITDLIPAYSSLGVYFDPLQLQKEKQGNESSFELMSVWIESLAMEEEAQEKNNGRLHEIPVCYAASMAPDLALAAHHKELSIQDFISIHTSATYHVFMIGFLPGFPYMGEVDERIAVPRKKVPGKDIAAGSVGIAGRQTGIYPFTSPGGWQIIGRTPVSLFNAVDESPVLFQPGDQVKFYSITENEFADHKGRNY